MIVERGIVTKIVQKGHYFITTEPEARPLSRSNSGTGPIKPLLNYEHVVRRAVDVAVIDPFVETLIDRNGAISLVSEILSSFVTPSSWTYRTCFLQIVSGDETIDGLSGNQLIGKSVLIKEEKRGSNCEWVIERILQNTITPENKEIKGFVYHATAHRELRVFAPGWPNDFVFSASRIENLTSFVGRWIVFYIDEYGTHNNTFKVLDAADESYLTAPPSVHTGEKFFKILMPCKRETVGSRMLYTMKFDPVDDSPNVLGAYGSRFKVFKDENVWLICGTEFGQRVRLVVSRNQNHLDNKRSISPSIDSWNDRDPETGWSLTQPLLSTNMRKARRIYENPVPEQQLNEYFPERNSLTRNSVDYVYTATTQLTSGSRHCMSADAPEFIPASRRSAERESDDIAPRASGRRSPPPINQNSIDKVPYSESKRTAKVTTISDDVSEFVDRCIPNLKLEDSPAGRSSRDTTLGRPRSPRIGPNYEDEPYQRPARVTAASKSLHVAVGSSEGKSTDLVAENAALRGQIEAMKRERDGYRVLFEVVRKEYDTWNFHDFIRSASHGLAHRLLDAINHIREQI